MKMARVGILIDRDIAEVLWGYKQNLFQVYIGEVLEHIGAPFHWIHSVNEVELNAFDCVIVAVCEEKEEKMDVLKAFMYRGGMILSFAGLNSLAKEFDMKVGGFVQQGYAHLNKTDGEQNPLRFFNMLPWLGDQTTNAIGHISANEKSYSLYQTFSYGTGRLCRWTIDIPSTIVFLQQGRFPVTRDGQPAPDGTANLDEGLLKADDGFELDWDKDRSHTETGTPYFPTPYADLWKEAFFTQLVKELLQIDLTLPFKAYWPEHVDQVAMISLDSDTNNEQSAYTTLDMVKKTEVSATWCMLEPGYSPELYDEIIDAGQEIALHYNAHEKDNGIWSPSEFNRQLTWLKEATGQQKIYSNKNHYTRFEGWGDFYKWCEENQIESDQSRGPSKKGNIGMLFGTCHPYFPVAWHNENNRTYDVLEIGFLTQDLNHRDLADTSVIRPFLNAIKQVNGVAHFLFHQIHLYNQPEVRNAFYEVIETARENGFTFWAGCEINGWERDRRAVTIIDLTDTLLPVVTGTLPTYNVVYHIPVKDNSEEADMELFGLQCVTTSMALPKNEALLEK